jgi:predicted transcriptional regulator
MVSLTVQLDDHVAEAVSKLAAAQNRSESEVVQEAVAVYAGMSRPVPQGMGKYHSGRADVSENAEDILRDAAKEGQWL